MNTPRNTELEKFLKANVLTCDMSGETIRATPGTTITVHTDGSVQVHAPEVAKGQREHDARVLAAGLLAREAGGAFVLEDGQAFTPELA